MKKKTSYDSKEVIEVTVMVIIVFLLHLIFSNKSQMPFLFSDERGYLAVASYFSGKNLPVMIADVPYYSYGYSFFIAPLYLLNNPNIFYNAIICLNALFVALSVLVAYFFFKKFEKSSNNYVAIFLSLVSVLLTGTSGKTNKVIPETLLILLFWLIIFVIQQILENPTYLKISLLSFLVFFSYITHQRTIVMIIAATMLLVLMVINKKISIKQFLVFIFTLVILFLPHSMNKSLIINDVWKNDKLAELNDYGTASGIFKLFFTSAGVYGFIRSLIGQLFYFGVCSFLLGYSGIILIVQYCFTYIKSIFKKDFLEQPKSQNEFYLYVFLLLAFLGTFAIGALYFMAPVRVDHVVYGRYFESMIGPIIMLGMNALYNKKISIKTFICQVLFFIVTAFLVKYFLSNLDVSLISKTNIIALTMYVNNLTDFLNIALAVAVILLFGLFVYFMTTSKNKLLFYVTSVIIIAYSFVIGYNSNSLASSNIIEINHNVTDMLQNTDNNVNFYCKGSSDYANFHVDQFILHQKPINIIDRDETENLSKNDIMITSDISKNLIQNYDLLQYNSKKFYTTPKTNNTEFVIDAKDFFEPDPIKPLDYDNFLTSNGIEEVFAQTYQMGIAKGKYNFDFELELISSTNDHIASVGLLQFNSDFVIKQYDLYKKDFVDGKFNLNFEVDTPQNISLAGFHFLSMDGSVLKIKSVTIIPL